jgi:hypothetical protein
MESAARLAAAFVRNGNVSATTKGIRYRNGRRGSAGRWSEGSGGL